MLVILFLFRFFNLLSLSFSFILYFFIACLFFFLFLCLLLFSSSSSSLPPSLLASFGYSPMFSLFYRIICTCFSLYLPTRKHSFTTSILFILIYIVKLKNLKDIFFYRQWSTFKKMKCTTKVEIIRETLLCFTYRSGASISMKQIAKYFLYQITKFTYPTCIFVRKGKSRFKRFISILHCIFSKYKPSKYDNLIVKLS